MEKKTRKRPLYPSPDWDQMDENESFFSYFEMSNGYQKSIQADVLKKVGKTKYLAQQLADASHAHADQFFEEVGKSFETECKAGCSYCCYQPATVFPFEAIRIAEALKQALSAEQLHSLKEKMKNRVAQLIDSSVKKSINNKAPCPLLSRDLKDSLERCSVYENRPLTCRMAHSFSVKRCRASFQKDRTQVQIPVSMELVTAMSGMIEGAFKQLPQKKLDGNLYELCSAVLAALSDPDAASKWAQGDSSVFENCVRDDT